MMGTAGAQQLLRYMDRLRMRLERMKDRTETVIRDYSKPTIGHRRNLYMNKLVDAIARVRHVNNSWLIITFTRGTCIEIRHMCVCARSLTVISRKRLEIIDSVTTEHLQEMAYGESNHDVIIACSISDKNCHADCHVQYQLELSTSRILKTSELLMSQFMLVMSQQFTIRQS